MKLDFTQTIVFITGAASGIGRATALAFAQAGAHIFAVDIHEEKGQETVSLVQDSGGKAAFFQADVSQESEVQAAVNACVQEFGRMDIGINNAGITGPWQKTHEYDSPSWDQVIAVNQSGVFYGMKYQIAHMLEQGSGSIVNVSSLAGMRALTHSLAYVASKHAVLGMTKVAALEYARKNIRINAICPVFTHSPLFHQMFDINPAFEEKLKKRIPIGRYGQPEEIAAGILWLSAPQSEFVTGICLPIDGGMNAG